MHRSQKKLVLVNGGFSGESGIDNNLYEGGRRGTKRMLEEYDNGESWQMVSFFNYIVLVHEWITQAPDF